MNQKDVKVRKQHFIANEKGIQAKMHVSLFYIIFKNLSSIKRER